MNCHVYPKEILPQVFGLFHEILSTIPAEARYCPEDFPDGVFITQGYCKFGYVGIGHNRPATEEDKEVIRRMAVEFERLYQRFIDLQKAELQIREAQIEAALERVRAGAMAMHSSDEVGGATGIMFSELDKLGISLLRCGLYIVDGGRKTMQVWRATTTAEGTIGQATGTVSMTIHPMLEAAYNAWQRRDALLSYTLAGDDLLQYYKALSAHAPQFTRNVPAEKQVSTSVFFPEGGLFAFSREPLEGETISVLKRFAAVFSLTYRRYLDLKNAEARAREAIRQASLDRVRAEIASMRTTGDLEQIIPVVWNELTKLGVPFIRCGVFIMDDLQQLIHTYLSTPDGKAIAAFDLPYQSPGSIPQIILHWQEKKLYTEYWNEAAYNEFAGNLVQQGIIDSPEPYLQTLPVGGFNLHFFPFLQGMLYVGSLSPLATDEVNLIQALANAFATAYARYEDFNKLEAAKQDVDKALLNLKQAQQQLIQAEKMASLGQLTAGIAHEIQNPLNFINNFSVVNAELVTEMKEEMARGHYEEAITIAGTVKDNAEKIAHHGRRADAIVKGMLEHSRKSDGKKEATDINALTEEYVRLAHHGFRTKENACTVTVETHYDSALDKISVLQHDLGRVLLNLLSNAFYAVAEKKKEWHDAFQPTVCVSTKKDGDSVVIAIKDNGTGMPQHVKEKVFQPFFTTKPAGEGTGLGLSLCYDIITKRHGGKVMVESREGEGTEFIVQLPAR